MTPEEFVDAIGTGSIVHNSGEHFYFSSRVHPRQFVLL